MFQVKRWHDIIYYYYNVVYLYDLLQPSVFTHCNLSNYIYKNIRHALSEIRYRARVLKHRLVATKIRYNNI